MYEMSRNLQKFAFFNEHDLFCVAFKTNHQKLFHIYLVVGELNKAV